MRFRKKPVVVEAIGFTGSNQREVSQWAEGLGSPCKVCWADDPPVLIIRALEGVVTADPGDWIICTDKRALYVCKPDVFTATYEPAE